MPALYRVEAKMISRADGKSAIAFAAYIDRTSYLNERTGVWTDNFKEHGQKEWSAVWIPEGAPEWMRDPQRMWNELEKREDKQNLRDKALLARTWIISIPYWEGQTKEDRLLFTKDILREHTRHGWVAHAAIHVPDGDSPNYHIHIGTPMRFVDENGFGLRREATTDGRFQKKREELEWWREKIADIGARHLKRAGLDLEAERFKHGHLTLDKQRDEAMKRGDQEWAQMCDREPTIHMGAAAMAMERKGIQTRVGAINYEREQRNAMRQEDYRIDRLLASLPAGVVVPMDLDRRNVPVWLAFERSKTAGEFRENLKKEGWQLARVTEEDAVASQNRRMVSEKFKGPYQPVFQPKDYVAVNPLGQAFHLNERSTGKPFREMKAFMAELDKEFVNSLRAAENFAEHKKAGIDGRPTGRLGRTHGGIRKSVAALRATAKAAGLGLDMAGVGIQLVGMFDRTLTPEEKIQRDLLVAKQKAADKHVHKAKQHEAERER